MSCLVFLSRLLPNIPRTLPPLPQRDWKIGTATPLTADVKKGSNPVIILKLQHFSHILAHPYIYIPFLLCVRTKNCNLKKFRFKREFRG
jgi:hypothetical protein